MAYTSPVTGSLKMRIIFVSEVKYNQQTYTQPPNNKVLLWTTIILPSRLSAPLALMAQSTLSLVNAVRMQGAVSTQAYLQLYGCVCGRGSDIDTTIC